MPGSSRFKLEPTNNSRRVINVPFSPASHVISDGVPPKYSGWIWDHDESDVDVFWLPSLLQPNLQDDVNESWLIMQLIPYPAFINQHGSACYDDDGESETGDYCHPGIVIAVVSLFGLENSPVVD